MTVEEEVEAILAQAWDYGAPNRDRNVQFPRGFWPDVARTAVYLALRHGLPIGFRQTQCVRGNYPEPVRTAGKKSSGKISAADKAANTAALLASLKGLPKP